MYRNSTVSRCWPFTDRLILTGNPPQTVSCDLLAANSRREDLISDDLGIPSSDRICGPLHVTVAPVSAIAVHDVVRVAGGLLWGLSIAMLAPSVTIETGSVLSVVWD